VPKDYVAEVIDSRQRPNVGEHTAISFGSATKVVLLQTRLRAKRRAKAGVDSEMAMMLGELSDSFLEGTGISSASGSIRDDRAGGDVSAANVEPFATDIDGLIGSVQSPESGVAALPTAATVRKQLTRMQLKSQRHLAREEDERWQFPLTSQASSRLLVSTMQRVLR
jgi:hypothetical protein